MMRVAAMLACLAVPAGAAQFNFCWAGANGYTMTGVIAFPDALMSRDMIIERDVTAFRIVGYERGVVIGSWSINDRAPGTTWHLRFVPATLTFPTGGSFPGEASQGWNADGDLKIADAVDLASTRAILRTISAGTGSGWNNPRLILQRRSGRRRSP